MVAQTVKQSLDTRKVFEYYGYKVNRRGFAPCPFHQEKTPSMKVYSGDKGWNCYGCQANGSVIDFVMEIFNLNYFGAITRLNYDFGLNLGFEKPSGREIEKRKKQLKLEEELKKKKNTEYMERLTEFKRYYRISHDKKPGTGKEPSEEYLQALLKLPQLEEWLLTRGEK